MSVNRDKALDVLKGIGILSMIMGHSNMGEIFTTYVAGFHMQLFFLVSGFLFNSKKYSLIQYTKRKAKSLLLPYATFAIVTLVVCLIVSFVSGSNVYGFPSCLLGIVYSNRSIFPITGAIWFLQCLFLVCVLFWFISRVPRIFQLIVLFVFSLLGYYQSKYDLHLPFALDSALTATLFYAVGFYARGFTDRLLGCRHSLVLGTILIVCSGISIFLNGQVNPRTCEYGFYPVYFINAILSVWGWYYIAKWLSNKAMGTLISRIGADSILYLGFNQLIILGLYKLFSVLFHFESTLWKGLRNIMIALLTTIVLYGLTAIINKSKIKYLFGK